MGVGDPSVLLCLWSSAFRLSFFSLVLLVSQSFVCVFRGPGDRTESGRRTTRRYISSPPPPFVPLHPSRLVCRRPRRHPAVSFFESPPLLLRLQMSQCILCHGGTQRKAGGPLAKWHTLCLLSRTGTHGVVERNLCLSCHSNVCVRPPTSPPPLLHCLDVYRVGWGDRSRPRVRDRRA